MFTRKTTTLSILIALTIALLAAIPVPAHAQGLHDGGNSCSFIQRIFGQCEQPVVIKIDPEKVEQKAQQAADWLKEHAPDGSARTFMIDGNPVSVTTWYAYCFADDGTPKTNFLGQPLCPKAAK